MKNLAPSGFAALLLLAPLALSAQAGEVIGPTGASSLGNPTGWVTTSVQGNGTIGVTRNEPRVGFGGFGAGSLEMSVSGELDPSSGQYPDWAFWYRYADGTAAGTIDNGARFGDLAQLSSLSFDWFRSATPGWDAPPGSTSNENGVLIAPLDWAYKTPVIRLQLRERRDGQDDILSELVWEGYYNKASLGTNENPDDNVTPVGKWVSQTDMQQDNFWYLRPPAVNGAAAYGTGEGCAAPMTFWQGGIVASNAFGLFGDEGCLQGASVDIIGIAVGVGSQWPLPYHAFVDNIQLGFTSPQARGGPDADPYVLNTNFDFIPVSNVPEPSAWALMGAGLLAVGAATRRRAAIARRERSRRALSV
jgi:hypothetical protein